MQHKKPFWLILVLLIFSFEFISGNLPGQKNSEKAVPYSKFKFKVIGAETKTGELKIAKHELQLNVGGADIWGKKDEFQFAYIVQNGDFDVCVQVKELSNAHKYTKAGIMARADLDDNSQHVFFQVFPDNSARNKNNGGCEFQYRVEKAGEMKAIYPDITTAGNKFNVSFPNTWIRLKRKGDVFESFISNDKMNWNLYSTFSIKIPNQVFLGLAVTSHNKSVLTTAGFGKLMFKK